VNKALKLFFLTVFSLFCIFFAFKDEDLGLLYQHLLEVDILILIFATILLIISCVVRAYRWQLLLIPFDHVSLRKVFSATMIGYFGNGILAFRLGELLKSYSVSKDSKINTMQAFGTVVIERLLDVLAVVSIFIFLIPWFPFEDKFIKYGALGFTSIALISIILLYFVSKYRLIGKIENKAIFSSGYGKSVFVGICRFFEGIDVISNNENRWRIFLSSVLLWSIYYIETILLVIACGLELGILEIGILLVLGSIAFGIPALPGSAGTYDASIKYSLVVVFNVGSIEALNYAIISHVVAYFPLLILGFIFFFISNVKINDFKQVKIYK